MLFPLYQALVFGTFHVDARFHSTRIVHVNPRIYTHSVSTLTSVVYAVSEYFQRIKWTMKAENCGCVIMHVHMYMCIVCAGMLRFLSIEKHINVTLERDLVFMAYSLTL